MIENLPGWAMPLASCVSLFVASDLGAWLVCRSSLAARRRWLPLLPPTLLALAAPLLMPLDWVILRLVLFVIAVVRPLKYWDAFTRFPTLPEERKGLARFCLFTLAALYTLDLTESFVRERPGKGPTRAAKLGVMGLGAARFLAGLALLETSLWWKPWDVNFFLNHVLEVFELYLIVGGALDVGLSLLRLAGFRVKDVLDWPILARDPADFWRRYNTMVHDWTMRYVFRPFGGSKRPDRGILAVFVLSGLIHEYVFSLASLKGWGYQMTFFLWQGVAVIVASGAAWKRAGKGRPRRRARAPLSRARLALLVGAHVVFFLLTSIFFMASFQNAIPLHPGAPPILP